MPTVTGGDDATRVVTRAREDEGVISYQRPSIDVLVFHDARGEVINYGGRWGGPPGLSRLQIRDQRAL